MEYCHSEPNPFRRSSSLPPFGTRMSRPVDPNNTLVFSSSLALEQLCSIASTSLLLNELHIIPCARRHSTHPTLSSLFSFKEKHLDIPDSNIPESNTQYSPPTTRPHTPICSSDIRSPPGPELSSRRNPRTKLPSLLAPSSKKVSLTGRHIQPQKDCRWLSGLWPLL